MYSPLRTVDVDPRVSADGADSLRPRRRYDAPPAAPVEPTVSTRRPGPSDDRTDYDRRRPRRGTGLRTTGVPRSPDATWALPRDLSEVVDGPRLLD